MTSPPFSAHNALQELFASDGIRLKRGPLFDQSPPPKDPSFDFSRIEGMLLGVAIGDALGLPTEAKLPHIRAEKHGEIRDYLPYKNKPKALALPSDDTLMTFWTLEQLIAHQGFQPDAVADSFTREPARGMGQNVKEFVKKRKHGQDWRVCGPSSAGNGALMRISPILLPHLRSGGTALWEETAVCAMLTHNDTLSLSTCLVFVSMLWDLLDATSTPAPSWWVERYAALGRDLEDGTTYQGRGGIFAQRQGAAWLMIQDAVTQAYSDGLSVLDACQRWHSGAYLLETWPCVLYILMRHADDPEEAIVRAVNDTKDNDTIAAIVGAAVGALHGKEAFPKRWMDGLHGRLRKHDDGAIFRLLAQAKALFWDGTTVS